MSDSVVNVGEDFLELVKGSRRFRKECGEFAPNRVLEPVLLRFLPEHTNEAEHVFEK